MDFTKKNTILITCARGLSPFLQKEIIDLGFRIQSFHNTGVIIEASFYDTLTLNLNLRTAYNVLYLLKNFNCTSTDELYKNVFSLDWEDIIPVDEYLTIVAHTNTPVINNSMFAGQKTKDAIVDRIFNKFSKRPNSGPKYDNVVINLFWKDDQCWLYLNTSGKKLSDRNYRKIPGKAPMQETLAAGVVIATEYTKNEPLINPMCGSGTLAIETALIALDYAPGLLRDNFGFMHIKNYDNTLWKNLKNTAENKIKENLSAPIIATDINSYAIDDAKKNAQAARVDHLIDFKVCNYSDTPIPKEKGIIIFNPEYGIRMGEVSQLIEIYKEIGNFLKQHCQGHTGYIFSGNTALAKNVGLRTSQRLVFFNGSIECRLLKYELYEGSRKST
ncbi:MAG: class I SAM-dependent RNA methyltransferase [Candidatus Omnitrophica bacterium]|nr:class I SAM-dependent RNA methyltransferase [Candidatus Omnitrophota bacterium]